MPSLPHPETVAIPLLLSSPGRMMDPKGCTGKRIGGGWGAHLEDVWGAVRRGVVVCGCRLGELS